VNGLKLIVFMLIIIAINWHQLVGRYFEWFHDKFAVVVKEHMKSHNNTQSAMLLFCKIPS
jgi:hypothetical protein